MFWCLFWGGWCSGGWVVVYWVRDGVMEVYFIGIGNFIIVYILVSDELFERFEIFIK